MADGLIQVAPDSTGKKIDATELTVGANTVERQRVNISDPTSATLHANVLVPADGLAAPGGALATAAYLMAWNGASWDRLTSDPSNSDAVAVQTSGLLDVDAHLRGFNGTSFDRIRCATNGGVAVAGNDGTAYRDLKTRADGALVVSLGSSSGKSVIGKTGNLVTTAVTADQVILTYTVTAGKTLYLLGASVQVRLTTYATTATNYGTASLETPSGTKINTQLMAHAGVIWPPPSLLFPEPIPIAAGTVIRWVCTPAATTSFTWQGNLWGYEV